jgi:hypothetical protein
VVDCDNFVTPCTLKYLIQKDKPIIAPMLRAIPRPTDNYSNFMFDVNANGYEKRHPDFYKILKKEKVGTFEVPIVHCTYLIKGEYLNRLTYCDYSRHHEYVIFSRIARHTGTPQYICNERDFGVLLHNGAKLTLAEERAQFQRWLNGQ